MSPGTPVRARPRGASAESNRLGPPYDGGCTFAEDPRRAAPDARLIWHAKLDPGTLSVAAYPCDPSDPDGVLIDRLRPWMSVQTDDHGLEHAVLSDGWHHIRLDITQGSIACERAVILRYRIAGLLSAEPKVLPLRQFLALCRHGRFARSLFPPDARVPRWIEMLRVHDALASGASHREIGAALFGEARAKADWNSPSDSLRSRVRRLIVGARTLALGGYRHLISQSVDRS